MPEFLTQLSAFTVFLGIAALGFLFLLISLIFGEMFEHLGIDHDVDGSDLDHGGPGFFSARVMSVFVTAFGGFGAVGTHYGLSMLPASGLGFVSGLFFATIIYFFARFLYGQQASTEVRTADLRGVSARVVVGIPLNGVGQVRCVIGEEMIDKIARSRSGEAIPENASVKVEEVLGEIVIVRPQ